MSRKQASKRRGRKKTVAVLGAAGVLSLAGGASAAIVGPATETPKDDTASRHVFTLSEEEIFDVSLGTFYVYDKESAARIHLAGPGGGKGGGCGGGGGCKGKGGGGCGGGGGGCGGGKGCGGGRGCGGRGCGGGCGGCGGGCGGGCCLWIGGIPIC